MVASININGSHCIKQILIYGGRPDLLSNEAIEKTKSIKIKFFKVYLNFMFRIGIIK